MCKSGKIVNVVLNSNNAINAGSGNNNLNYFIDWSAILENGKSYILHWIYTSQVNTFTVATKIAQVQINFQMDNYLNKSSTYGAPNTTYIGVLQPKTYFNGQNWVLTADDTLNVPIYMKTRPYNNIFNVQVLTNDSPPVLWTDSAAVPIPNANYIMTLSFQEVDN
jgi:hypothetical protein